MRSCCGGGRGGALSLRTSEYSSSLSITLFSLRSDSDGRPFRIYSYVLGRPQILRRDLYDVELFPVHNADGSRNLINFGLNIFVSLMDLLSEAIEKVPDFVVS